MKNRFRNALVFLLFLATLHGAQAQYLFVATNGHEQASGSMQDPFSNLPAAIRKARQMAEAHQSGSGGIHIFLRKGTYHIRETIELTEGKTWTSVVPLNIAAYKGEEVTLHGGKSVPVTAATRITDAGFAKRLLPSLAQKILQIDLAKNGITDLGTLRPTGFAHPYGPAPLELFVNGTPGRTARWPNNGTVLIDKLIDSGSVPRWGDTIDRGGRFTYTGTNRPSRWKEPEKAWLYGFFMWGYADETVSLKEIDTLNRTITTAMPSTYGYGTGKPWRAWYALNIPEEIDTTGEYYLDRDKKILYFYPPDHLKSIDVSLLEAPLLALEGVQHVTVSGLTVTCSRGMGIYMERTRGVRIKRCTFSNLGMMAISMGKGVTPFDQYKPGGSGVPAARLVGSLVQYVYDNSTFDREGGFNNGIEDCEVFQTGAGGIFLSGGNRVTLEPGNSYVQNCVVHDFNRLERTHRPGIWIAGVGNRITHSEVYNAPSLGVLLHGNDHLFEYNNLHDVAREVDDMGAFYYGRDPSEQGNVIRNNYFHDIGSRHRTMAIYHDDGACAMTVYNNVFYKAGLIAGFIGGGQDNKYYNNIFIDTRFASHIDDRLNDWATAMLDSNGLFRKRLQAVHFDQPPYATRYPRLVSYFTDHPEIPKRDTFTHNVLVNIGTPTEVPVKRSKAGQYLVFSPANNLILQSDPGFVSYETKDFRLKPTSEVYQKLPAFRPIPFELMGYRKKKREK